ncbi:MAG: branched-chain amino acid ABC transporter permease [Solirubrobacteraceae bacterium]
MRSLTKSPLQLAAPILLIVVTTLLEGVVAFPQQIEFSNALVMVAIVVSLYVFVGNSGVISFGQVSFAAVGGYLSGVITLDAQTKTFTMPTLFPILLHAQIGLVPSLALAAAAGGIFALLAGLPIMRLSGLPAGIATLAVLGITYNVLYYWGKVGPGPQTLSSIPQIGRWTLALGTIVIVVIAFGYQRTRSGRQLRATREDRAAALAYGINVYRQRLLAFTLSGALSGLAGALYVHQLGLIEPSDQFYLTLTFLTLAMLVVGGTHSLWGAVVGALAISAVNSFFSDAENTVHILGLRLTVPSGTDLVVVGVLMLLVLILRPSGLTGGREFGWPHWSRRPSTPSAEDEPLDVAHAAVPGAPAPHGSGTELG